MVTQRRKCTTTDLEFGTYTFLTKLIPGDNCYGWSPTILMMAAHQLKDGHQPEGSVLRTRNLALRLYSQNRWKMMVFDTEELILVYYVNRISY